MKTRLASSAFALAVLTAPLAVEAQQAAKIRRVGYLTLGGACGGPTATELGAFRERLGQLGWPEGNNVAIECRTGKTEQLPTLAAELVALHVEVIVTITTPGALAAKQATSTIPIVMAGSGDAVQRGLVASLARPGGNITGLTNYPGPEFVVKQLQLLKEVAPRISRAAVLMSSSFPPTVDSFTAMQAAGGTLGVTPFAIEMNRPGPFDPAVVLRERADALVVTPIPLNWDHQQAILDLAAKHRLPAMYGENDGVRLGGLMSYWTDWLDLRRRAAVYVDKILKGAKPADLPVAQEIEDVQGVTPIGLRLTHDHGTNLRGIADEQRVPEALHEHVKPDRVARALNTDRHRPRQRGIELFDPHPVVSQMAFTHLSRAGVQHGHLLRARMEIASDECHGVGPLSESAVAHGEHSNSARPFS